MKKSLIAFSAILGLSFALVGCLKDKKFDNHEYGIKDPAGSPDGVGFTLGTTAIQTRGLDVTASPQTISDLLILNLLAEKAATSDVTVTISTDTSIVRAYNTANGTSILNLPTTSYSGATFTRTIKAGQRLDSIPVSIVTTATLDATKSYGVGFRITAVSNGYTIAANYRTVLLNINIKNKYDGKYSLKGFFVRTDAAGAALNGPFATNVQMITTGPNSVGMYSTLFNPATYIQPFSSGGAITGFSNLGPNFIFNTTTNKVTSITNLTGALVCTPFPGYDSRYEPSTKTMYVKYYYNADPTNRIFTDTLTYTGPR